MGTQIKKNEKGTALLLQAERKENERKTVGGRDGWQDEREEEVLLMLLDAVIVPLARLGLHTIFFLLPILVRVMLHRYLLRKQNWWSQTTGIRGQGRMVTGEVLKVCFEDVLLLVLVLLLGPGSAVRNP